MPARFSAGIVKSSTPYGNVALVSNAVVVPCVTTIPTREIFDRRKRSVIALRTRRVRGQLLERRRRLLVGPEVLGRRAVDRRRGHRAQLRQEAGHELVVAEVVLDARLVQRPGAGVEVGDLGHRLGVAGLEQPHRHGVVALERVVVEADQRLQERVDDRDVRRERVLQKADAEPGLDRDAGRRRVRNTGSALPAMLR